MKGKIEHRIRVIFKDSKMPAGNLVADPSRNPCVSCDCDQTPPPAWATAFVESPEFAAARRFTRDHASNPEAFPLVLTEAEKLAWARNIAGRYNPESVAVQFWEGVEHIVYRALHGPLPGSRFIAAEEDGVAIFEMEPGADGQAVPQAPCEAGGQCPSRISQ